MSAACVAPVASAAWQELADVLAALRSGRHTYVANRGRSEPGWGHAPSAASTPDRGAVRRYGDRWLCRRLVDDPTVRLRHQVAEEAR